MELGREPCIDVAGADNQLPFDATPSSLRSALRWVAN
jgi:hypothetical protein